MEAFPLSKPHLAEDPQNNEASRLEMFQIKKSLSPDAMVQLQDRRRSRWILWSSPSYCHPKSLFYLVNIWTYVFLHNCHNVFQTLPDNWIFQSRDQYSGPALLAGPAFPDQKNLKNHTLESNVKKQKQKNAVRRSLLQRN